jgi:hypothetical protein
MEVTSTLKAYHARGRSPNGGSRKGGVSRIRNTANTTVQSSSIIRVSMVGPPETDPPGIIDQWI